MRFEEGEFIGGRLVGPEGLEDRWFQIDNSLRELGLTDSEQKKLMGRTLAEAEVYFFDQDRNEGTFSEMEKVCNGVGALLDWLGDVLRVDDEQKAACLRTPNPKLGGKSFLDYINGDLEKFEKLKNLEFGKTQEIDHER